MDPATAPSTRNAGRAGGRKPKTRFTLLRQWAMLKALPSWPGKVTYAELASRMEADGYKVDPNTVRRDLDELSGIFPIYIESEERTHHCCWAKGADPDLRALSIPEALALRMVEQYLGQLLPTTVLDVIEGPFARARQTLEGLRASNPTATWIDKVRAIPPTQPMLPPEIEPAVHDAVCRALIEGKQLQASYRPFGEQQGGDYLLHPLALILRTPSVYLVAKAWDYPRPEDVRLYALHRFQAVEVLDDAIIPPDDWNLDREIARGLADFGERCDPIEIELLATKELAEILRETPLAVRGHPPMSTQTITPEPDGSFRVRATVNDTWQLRWWLRAQADAARVLKIPGN
jgi:predicted DNA-binding transcriptional regulator YafY